MPTKNLLSNAKTLRQHSTEAEKRLWYHLRAKRFEGIKFKRQKPIGPYIVDFVAVDKKLVIEVDGGQHQGCAADEERTRYLESCGYRVLRFWNTDCLTKTQTVLECLRQALAILEKDSVP